MKTYLTSAFALLTVVASLCAFDSPKVKLDKGVSIFTAIPYNSKNLYTLDKNSSSEFNGGIKNDNYVVADQPFPTWSMRPENVTVENGNLNLTARHEKHMSKSGKEFYFTSGMISTKSQSVYGYYEARIKGADLWPGVCPAFWLQGHESRDIQTLPVNTILYSEIDIIELQQVATSKNMLALNLHTAAVKEGKDGKHERLALKAGIIPKICKTEFPVEWNPEDDYHVYACENRPDSILFYIDNVRVGAKPNYYWHLPMKLIISMGMRNPYERYEAWDRFAVPATADEAKAAGFPTTMYIDYVRVYNRDYSEFKSSKQLFDFEASGYDQEKVDMILRTRKENL